METLWDRFKQKIKRIDFETIKLCVGVIFMAALIFIAAANGFAELTAEKWPEYETNIEIVDVDIDKHYNSNDETYDYYYYVTVNIKGDEYRKQFQYYEYKYAKRNINQEVPARIKERTVNFLGENETRYSIQFIELDDATFWQKLFG